MASLKEEWEQNASSDPYWSVLSIDKFRSASVETSIEDFFQTGHDHVEYVINRLNRDFGFAVPGNGSAIDFGCGVGRCTVALLSHFAKVTGYDVADRMLDLARANILRIRATGRGGLTSSFALTSEPEYLSLRERSADLIHSVLVFQHIPPAEGYVEMGRLINCVAEGGAGFIHVSVARRLKDAGQLINSYSESALRIKMFAYDTSKILDILADGKASRVTIDLRDMGDRLLSANIFFRRM